MVADPLLEFTRKILELDGKNKLFIRKTHIENERKYREINLEHVQRVLKSGHVTAVRDNGSSVIWQGHDADGRLLELNCTLKNEGGEITVIVEEASTAIVGTAYDPSKDDDKLKADWLKDNDGFEDAGKRFGVRKKITVTRV